MNGQMIKDKIEELPDDLKREVLDYAEFLIAKYSKKSKSEKFKFDWEGGLAELKDESTSVELQHKAAGLR